MFGSPRVYAVIGSAAAFLSTGIFAVMAAAALNGAIYTTDSAGNHVNENIYQVPADVYVNGGPNNANSQGLPPNEVFYYEVTDPSGRTLLSNDPANCRQVRTDANGRVSGVYTGDGCSHSVGTVDAANGALPVRLWPFSRTPNEGNEYKVTLVKKSAPGVSVESDGKHLDYPRSATKTDNFKVLMYVSPDPDPNPNPNPSPSPTPNPSPTPTPTNT